VVTSAGLISLSLLIFVVVSSSFYLALLFLTQGFALAKQVHYRLSHFALVIFSFSFFSFFFFVSMGG
jgi:hypothetical protein